MPRVCLRQVEVVLRSVVVSMVMVVVMEEEKEEVGTCLRHTDTNVPVFFIARRLQSPSEERDLWKLKWRV